jgi:hypothetical protein
MCVSGVCLHPLSVATVAFGAPLVHLVVDCFGLSRGGRRNKHPVLMLILRAILAIFPGFCI